MQTQSLRQWAPWFNCWSFCWQSPNLVTEGSFLCFLSLSRIGIKPSSNAWAWLWGPVWPEALLVLLPHMVVQISGGHFKLPELEPSRAVAVALLFTFHLWSFLRPVRKNNLIFRHRYVLLAFHFYILFLTALCLEQIVSD